MKGVCIDCKHFKRVLEYDLLTIVGFVCGIQHRQGCFIETAANMTCEHYEARLAELGGKAND